MLPERWPFMAAKPGTSWHVRLLGMKARADAPVRAACGCAELLAKRAQLSLDFCDPRFHLCPAVWERLCAKVKDRCL